MARILAVGLLLRRPWIRLPPVKQQMLHTAPLMRALMIRIVFPALLVLLSLAGPATAQTCPATLTQLTNGTNADATQVMGNFNGILGCVRWKLTGAVTYYVSTTGNDSNSGSQASPFLTIQKCVDTASSLDLGIYNVTCQVAAGTYTGAIVLKSTVGVGTVFIMGNTTNPTSVSISVTPQSGAGAAIVADTVRGKYTIQGVHIETATQGYCIHTIGSALDFGQIDFGQAGGGSANHLYIEGLSRVTAIAQYSISGNAAQHIVVRGGSYLDMTGVAVTLNGTPTLNPYVYAETSATYRAVGMTFTGTSSGSRYTVTLNAVISTNNAGPNYLPGNSVGVSTMGGVYY